MSVKRHSWVACVVLVHAQLLLYQQRPVGTTGSCLPAPRDKERCCPVRMLILSRSPPLSRLLLALLHCIL